MNILINENEYLQQLKSEDGALDQSLALSKITMGLLHDRAADCRRLWIALIISIALNLCTVIGFLWYESQWERSETITTTVTQDTQDGTGNNIYQSGKDASYTQYNSKEDVLNGETNNNNYTDDNQDKSLN